MTDNNTPTDKDLVPRGGAIHIQPSNKTYTLAHARKVGARLYWNGHTCSNGHNSVRYTKDGVCKECYGNKTKRGSLEVVDREKEPLVPKSDVFGYFHNK